MPVTTVSLAGDRSWLTIRAQNITGPDSVDFLSGSFRSTPEERRVASVFLEVTTAPAKSFELRFEFSDVAFTETNIKGVLLPSRVRG